MNNARISTCRVVRPFDGFEGVYQGLAGTVPIAFPGTPDPLAGRPGYASNLLAGITMPLGARALVQIPMTVDLYTPEPEYTYQFLWRMRGDQLFKDQMEARVAAEAPAGYHLRGEQPGRRELQSSRSELVFMPGSSDIEIFEEDPAPVGSALSTVVVRQQRYRPTMGASWVQPRLPNGESAIWQQGTYQYSSDDNNSGPTWFPIWTDVNGDDLLILVYKNAGESNWDFAGDDAAFSNTSGTNNGGLPKNPNVGILISTGTMGA